MAKFADLDEFYASLPSDQESATRRLVDWVAAAHHNLNLVLAWNQPMFKLGSAYLIGFMPTKRHINLLTVTDTPITECADAIGSLRHGTRSVSLPFDWPFDDALLHAILQSRTCELGVSLPG